MLSTLTGSDDKSRWLLLTLTLMLLALVACSGEDESILGHTATVKTVILCGGTIAGAFAIDDYGWQDLSPMDRARKIRGALRSSDGLTLVSDDTVKFIAHDQYGSKDFTQLQRQRDGAKSARVCTFGVS